MTVLSFISEGTDKVSFLSWRNRNASEKLQERGGKKIQQNYWSIKAEMRKRKKKGYGYIFVMVFIPHKESQPFEGEKKNKNLSWTQPHCCLDGMYRFIGYSFSLAFHLSVFLILSLLFAQPIRSSASSSGHFVIRVHPTDLGGQFVSESSVQSRFWPWTISHVNPDELECHSPLRIGSLGLVAEIYLFIFTLCRAWYPPSAVIQFMLPFCHMLLLWG